jgi:putative transposase
MPNHWHFLLWPEEDGQLSKFMHWLTGTHAGRWRRDTVSQGQGAVYQSRFKAVPVETLRELLTVWRYVERNPVEAGMVIEAQHWPWSSAGQTSNPAPDLVLDPAPITRPSTWLALVNQPEIEFDTDVRFA